MIKTPKQMKNLEVDMLIKSIHRWILRFKYHDEIIRDARNIIKLVHSKA